MLEEPASTIVFTCTWISGGCSVPVLWLICKAAVALSQPPVLELAPTGTRGSHGTGTHGPFPWRLTRWVWWDASAHSYWDVCVCMGLICQERVWNWQSTAIPTCRADLSRENEIVSWCYVACGAVLPRERVGLAKL